MSAAHQVQQGNVRRNSGNMTNKVSSHSPKSKAFLNTMKKRFQNDRKKYEDFLNIMKSFRNNQTSADETMLKAITHLHDHKDMCRELVDIIGPRFSLIIRQDGRMLLSSSTMTNVLVPIDKNMDCRGGEDDRRQWYKNAKNQLSEKSFNDVFMLTDDHNRRNTTFLDFAPKFAEALYPHVDLIKAFNPFLSKGHFKITEDGKIVAVVNYQDRFLELELGASIEDEVKRESSGEERNKEHNVEKPHIEHIDFTDVAEVADASDSSVQN